MALYGTKKIEYAPAAADGTTPAEAAWKTLCKTYRDSVEIVDGDPTTEEEYSDQDDGPIVSFVEPGKTTGKFSTYEYDTQTLTTLLGGSTLDDEYVEGDGKGQEIALRFFTDSGHRITYPKVKLFGKKNIALKKKNVALVEMTFTPLSKMRFKKMP